MESISADDPRIIFGKDLADAIIEEVTDGVEELKATGHQPLLMTLEAGGDPASKVYQESQRRVARRAGINYETIELSEATSQQRLIKYVDRINRDPYINGLIVNLPLPEHVNTTQVQWAINRKKDVEGVTPCNLGGLFLGAEGLLPCTAQAILALIKSTGIEL